jgi:hypothetical protein
MKALTTPKGTFGPFASIEVLADRYRCDNTDLPFSVVGTGEIVEADTIDWPAPPTPAPVVPESVTPRQIRQAMTAAGMRASVEAAIAQANQDTKDWYEYATEFRRDHQAVADLAAVLDITTEQLDSLWILAGSL